MTEPRLAEFTLFGHRGAAGLAPENTLAAFEAGIHAGLRWMELDVQAHPEALIVFHDDRLDRCAGVSGTVLETPLRELRALDVGAGQRIPELDTLLDQLSERAALNIELKAGADVGPRTAEALRTALTAGWSAEDLLVSSFDHAALTAFHAALPEVPVAPLFDFDAANAEAVAASLGSRIVHLHRALAGAATLGRLASAGLRAHIFTVNDVAQAEALRAAGAAGIFTDHPERFRLISAMSQKRHSAGVQ
jgi:glycerophosphoryl diester phosphodiesterase